MRFLNDNSTEISEKYDWCFENLKPENFNDIYNLIYEYSHSEVIKKHAEHFFEFLIKCTYLHPEKCIDLIQNWAAYTILVAI